MKFALSTLVLLLLSLPILAQDAGKISYSPSHGSDTGYSGHTETNAVPSVPEPPSPVADTSPEQEPATKPPSYSTSTQWPAFVAGLICGVITAAILVYLLFRFESKVP